jgi:UDP-N-acetylmuramoyl-tripeptide--D-alanyl-D-alanine ligase
MDHFNLAQVGRWLGLPCKSTGTIRTFQHDSRQVQKGDLFFAIKGEKVDGHDYLMQVASQGALGAIVSKEYRGDDHGLVLFRVEDVIVALHRLATCVFQQRKQRVVGVTGSVGKTMTKEFIATLLEGSYSVEKTPGNANSQVTLPLTILNGFGSSDAAVIEMGMSLPGEMERLVAIAPPEIAVVTKVALSHAAFFPEGLEGIAREKAMILMSSRTQWGIVNAQAMGFEVIKSTGTCHKLSYSLQEDFPGADIVLGKVGLHYQVRGKVGESPLFTLPFQAPHLCENFLAAAIVCRLMQMEWEMIVSQAQQLKMNQNRFERIERKGITFLNDSYNANPTSMKAALLNMPTPQVGGKAIALLGSMKELGKFCECSHREIAEVAKDRIDHLICLGEECQPMVTYFIQQGKSVKWAESLSNAREYLSELAKPGDVVLLKGSNSHQLWKVLESF